MTITAVARTRDGEYRVFMHEDQTAELADATGNNTGLGRVPIFKVGRQLAELGYETTDLIAE